MINSLWKKVCDNNGVTPRWEYKNCLTEIQELDRRINNANEYIQELENKMLEQGKKLGSKNFVCKNIQNNITRHQQNIDKLSLEKEALTIKLNNMKLDF
jgi:predicted  nucleic acid-binding Zn-ribbon protein